jgi:hypothetical protein
MTTANPDAVLKVFADELAALPSNPPVILPNKMQPAALPFLVLARAGRETEDRSLGGDMEVTTGQMVVTVVTSLNSFTSAGDTLATEVANAFPRLWSRGTYDGKVVQVTDPPNILDGYSDEVNWRTPIIIKWSVK